MVEYIRHLLRKLMVIEKVDSMIHSWRQIFIHFPVTNLTINFLFFFLYFSEKDESNEYHKAQSKAASLAPTSSSAIARSDHLIKLNLDIGSMVEVRFAIFYEYSTMI